MSSGFDALRKANISYDQYQGFVCRLAGKPEEGPCDRYPPADAYWAYFTASPGGQWTYSKVGAGSRQATHGFLRRLVVLDGSRRVESAAAALSGAGCACGDHHDDARRHLSVDARARAAGGHQRRSRSRRHATESFVDDDADRTGARRDHGHDLIRRRPRRRRATTSRIALGTVDLSSDGGGSGTSAGFVASIGVVAALGILGFVLVRRRASMPRRRPFTAGTASRRVVVVGARSRGGREPHHQSVVARGRCHRGADGYRRRAPRAGRDAVG